MAAPVLAFDYLVMPELADLAETYQNFDATAQKIATN
jgi:hypothetical protein